MHCLVHTSVVWPCRPRPQTPDLQDSQAARGAVLHGRPSRNQCRLECHAVQAAEADNARQILADTTKRISLLGKQGKAREAVKQLADMARQHGVQPDTQAATALLAACCRNRQVDLARSVFDELFGNAKFLTADDVTFAVLVRGYGSCQPPDWSAISLLLNTMEQQYQCKPGIAVYNALLEACAQSRDEERGTAIIERMRAAGVNPNEFTFRAVDKRKVLRRQISRLFSAQQSDDEL